MHLNTNSKITRYVQRLLLRYLMILTSLMPPSFVVRKKKYGFQKKYKYSEWGVRKMVKIRPL